MGTTSQGLPYPENSDFVTQGDDAIKALANALDPMLIRHGRMLRTNPAGTGGTIGDNAWYQVGFYESYGLASRGTMGVTTTSLTASIAGLYLVGAFVEYPVGAAATRALRVLVNGAEPSPHLAQASSGAFGGARPMLSAFGIIPLTVGQVLTVQTFQNVGASAVIQSASLSAHLLAL